MSQETLIAFTTFAIISSLTPGPNNLMLMVSGVNFGFRRTLPHMWGITLGVSFMYLVIGLGISKVFDLWPPAYTILKVVSVVYMLWLSWKIATSAAPTAKSSTAKPLTFVQGALFQWVNPKAWSMGLTASTLYNAEHDAHGVFVIVLIFALVNVPTVALWAWMGNALQRWLQNPKYLFVFNLVMAASLVASLALIL